MKSTGKINKLTEYEMKSCDVQGEWLDVRTRNIIILSQHVPRRSRRCLERAIRKDALR